MIHTASCSRIRMYQRPVASREAVTTIRLDIARNIFQVHGVDAGDRVQLRRAEILGFFASMPPCVAGMEARASSPLPDQHDQFLAPRDATSSTDDDGVIFRPLALVHGCGIGRPLSFGLFIDSSANCLSGLRSFCWQIGVGIGWLITTR